MNSNLADVILAHIDNELRDVYTAIPATITDVSNFSENIVSVQPAISEREPNDQVYQLPILEDLPIIWPSGGGAVMTFPLKVGDDVMVVFSKSSTSEFQASSDGTVAPYDRRQHDIADGYVMPSIYRDINNPKPDPDHFEIRFGKGEISIKDDDTLEIFNDKASVTISPEGDIRLVNGNGNYNVNSDGTHSGESKETWSMTNGTGELIDLLTQCLQTISDTTVNTIYGPVPLNSKPLIDALIAQIETFKE